MIAVVVAAWLLRPGRTTESATVDGASLEVHEVAVESGSGSGEVCVYVDFTVRNDTAVAGYLNRDKVSIGYDDPGGQLGSAGPNGMFDEAYRCDHQSAPIFEDILGPNLDAFGSVRMVVGGAAPKGATLTHFTVTIAGQQLEGQWYLPTRLEAPVTGAVALGTADEAHKSGKTPLLQPYPFKPIRTT